MEITVKYAEDEDYSAIVNLVKENEIMGMPEEMLTMGYSSPAQIKQRVQAGMETIFVAKAAETPVGFVVITTGVSHDICAIPLVLVDPVHRRKGVASLLIQKSIDELKKIGAIKL